VWMAVAFAEAKVPTNSALRVDETLWGGVPRVGLMLSYSCVNVLQCHDSGMLKALAAHRSFCSRHDVEFKWMHGRFRLVGFSELGIINAAQ